VQHVYKNILFPLLSKQNYVNYKLINVIYMLQLM